MRFLYHHRTLGDGAEGIHVSSIVEALRGLGHEVKVAAVIGELTNITTARTRLLTRVARGVPRLAYELMELGYSAVGYQALRRHIRSWHPDALYERYTLFNLAGLAAARRAGLPLLLEVNAPLAHERSHYERLVLQSVARRCEVGVCREADAVIVVSTPLKDHLVREGVRPDRIVVLPNGADADRFQPSPAARDEIRTRHGIPRDATVVGFTGILRPWHGVELLLQALARMRATHPAVHALIVGDGPSLPALRRLAADLGIQNEVAFTGRVAHDLIPRYIAAFDIGVSPRATFYASPMKVLEYMASGVAVVAPRMRNLEDLITDGTTGELFEPESIDGLALVFRRLAADPTRRVTLGRAARAEIVRGRTWRHNADRIAALAAACRPAPHALHRAVQRRSAIEATTSHAPATASVSTSEIGQGPPSAAAR